MLEKILTWIKLFFFGFLDKVLVCSPGWIQTRDPPASTTQPLGLQVCAPWLAELH
jgi:hypothetical protein